LCGLLIEERKTGGAEQAASKMTRGLVVGKFDPPHRGHKHLIDTAQARCEALIVLVCASSAESIPAEQRAAWLREIHPVADVRVIPDIGRDDDSQAWAAHTVRFLGFAPQVVFTSEDYGPRYAQLMNARHVMVDRERLQLPVSSTWVRENPLACWEYLEPCVRAHYSVRVCVIGAESSGTTTLAEALARHYQTSWVPEYGRYYTEATRYWRKGLEWTSDEFLHIAEMQNRWEDWLARNCNKILFSDTDSFATALWHERYMGALLPALEPLFAGRRYALYLLTDVDIPYAQDAIRDGKAIRHAMHRRFEEEMTRRGKPFLLLSGRHTERMQRAVAACDKLLRGKEAEKT
jgi:NadR type nicotinamide-nucleotide adenylyltransferase